MSGSIYNTALRISWYGVTWHRALEITYFYLFGPDFDQEKS